MSDASNFPVVEPGSAVFDVPAQPQSIWGEDDECLWPKLQPLMLYANTGLGKTTVVQRVALARIGIGPSEVLGYPVEPLPAGEKIIYIAADRPIQAMASLRRMVTDDDETRRILDERWIWETKRQVRADRPNAFLELCERHNGTMLILDSAKDVAPGPLKDEEPAGKLVDAWSRCIANEIDVAAMHHPRKGQSSTAPPDSVDEIYGSSMLANGAGSILSMYGVPGSGTAGMVQLKMPARQAPAMDIVFNYETGTITRRNYRDLNDFLQRGEWVTVRQVAAFLYAKPEHEVTHPERKRATRKLQNLVTKRLVDERLQGQHHEYRWTVGRLET